MNEAKRSLKHYLAARRLIDFDGPHGWEHSAVDLGRVTPVARARSKAFPRCGGASSRSSSSRAPFFVPRSELAAADRGADDVDLDPVIAAGRAAALAEDGLVFDGYEAADITGIIPSSPHPAVTIGDDYARYPEHVARAVAVLRAADIDGPYAVAFGDRCFTGVTETTEHGGYPVFHHLREILGGPVVWGPAVDGAVVLSQRGGDFEITIGEDFSIGYIGSRRRRGAALHRGDRGVPREHTGRPPCTWPIRRTREAARREASDARLTSAPTSGARPSPADVHGWAPDHVGDHARTLGKVDERDGVQA